jgi:hypothetical protein
MMSGSPLDDINFDEAFDKDQWLQRKQISHEDRIVKYILKYIGKPGLIPQLRQRGKELSNSTQLHFGLFYEAVPDFPIWMGSRHVPFAHRDLNLWNIQQRFTKLRIWEAYLDVKSDVPRHWGGYVAMIFRTGKMRGAYGATVLHDAPCVLNDYWLQKKVRDTVYTIEGLVTFLDRL